MVKITLKINGMMCIMCARHMNEAIREKFIVDEVNSSFEKGETVIKSKKDIPEEELRKVVEKAGYKLISVSKVTTKKKLFGIFG